MIECRRLDGLAAGLAEHAFVGCAAEAVRAHEAHARRCQRRLRAAVLAGELCWCAGSAAGFAVLNGWCIRFHERHLHQKPAQATKFLPNFVIRDVPLPLALLAEKNSLDHALQPTH